MAVSVDGTFHLFDRCTDGEVIFQQEVFAAGGGVFATPVVPLRGIADAVGVFFGSGGLFLRVFDAVVVGEGARCYMVGQRAEVVAFAGDEIKGTGLGLGEVTSHTIDR